MSKAFLIARYFLVFCIIAAVTYLINIIWTTHQNQTLLLNLPVLIEKKLHVEQSERNYPVECHHEMHSLNSRTLTVIVSLQTERQAVISQTVYSILGFSNRALLREVILIVSDSITEDLYSFLVREFTPLGSLVRFQQTGFSENKLVSLLEIGQNNAHGDFVLYIDDATVVTKGYMMSLISQLSHHEEIIWVPEEDTLGSTLVVAPTNYIYKEVYDLDLTYTLYNQTDRLLYTPNIYDQLEVNPVAFALSKNYLSRLLPLIQESWSTTGLELGLASWMCGGGVRVLPCSRVAAVGSIRPQEALESRRRIAATFFSGKYLQYFNSITQSSVTNNGLLDKHHCLRNMDWLMEQAASRDIYKPSDDVHEYGRLKSTVKTCFRLTNENRFLKTACSVMSKLDIVEYTHDKLLRVNNSCIIGGVDGYMMTTICDSKSNKQIWQKSKEGRFYQHSTCLSHATDPDVTQNSRQIIMYTSCNDRDLSFQRWSFKPISNFQ